MRYGDKTVSPVHIDKLYNNRWNRGPRGEHWSRDQIWCEGSGPERGRGRPEDSERDSSLLTRRTSTLKAPPSSVTLAAKKQDGDSLNAELLVYKPMGEVTVTTSTSYIQSTATLRATKTKRSKATKTHLPAPPPSSDSFEDWCQLNHRPGEGGGDGHASTAQEREEEMATPRPPRRGRRRWPRLHRPGEGGGDGHASTAQEREEEMATPPPPRTGRRRWPRLHRPGEKGGDGHASTAQEKKEEMATPPYPQTD
ncbi:uncharacterized protein LOC117737906 [Cyclopterus lumpus]|uniref:uncharacterized protein LOC117737906 n=1 Tax=Cyclopterus lumpus TaxID=8103 RepID=UPI0014872E30|nr:uncharacterized protein LOC117737906 [Cyclopterus lumpus]